MANTTKLTASAYDLSVSIEIPQDSDIHEHLNALMIILRGISFDESIIKKGIIELAESYNND